MATLRRRRGRRKQAAALGSFITDQLFELRGLADSLNGSPGWEPLLSDADAGASRAMVADMAARAEDAAGVVAAVAGAAFPQLPAAAAAAFNTFAGSSPIHYAAVASPLSVFSEPQYARQRLFTAGSIYVYLRTDTTRGAWAILLARFLVNPQRDRLRRCPTCRRWFVDETRNKSARRCSRLCTIAWSNRQRGRRRST